MQELYPRLENYFCGTAFEGNRAAETQVVLMLQIAENCDRIVVVYP